MSVVINPIYWNNCFHLIFALVSFYQSIFGCFSNQCLLRILYFSLIPNSFGQFYASL